MRLIPAMVLSGLMFFMAVSVSAAPSSLNYQGYLTDNAGNPVPDDTYNMIFVIYVDPNGVSEIWNSGTIAVPVVDGLFNVSLDGIGASDFALDLDYYLGIKVGLDPEIRPLTKLSAAPFAFKAETAESVQNGAIDNAAVNVNANIDPSKISGNAAVLDLANTFNYWNTFTNWTYFNNIVLFSDNASPDAAVAFYDSTMIVDDVGISIGNDELPVLHSPLVIERHYNINSPSSRYGGLSHVFNAGTGTLFGLWSKAQRTSASSTNKYTYGLYGNGTNDHEVGTAIGVYGYAVGGDFTRGVQGVVNGTHNESEYAGFFLGDVGIQGEIIYLLGGYKIDHPSDPENKYLYHSNVSSPDMMNIYNGNVITDADGRAVVSLPDYFEDLNMAFRYQLTVVGVFAQAIIAEEITDNQFVIATSQPNVKVSWMITGVRKDPFAQDRRLETEKTKNDKERGLYVYPEGHGFGKELSVNYKDYQRALEIAEGRGGDE